MRANVAPDESFTRRASGRRWPWAVAAGAIVVAGSAGSWATANAIAREAAQHRRQSLEEATGAIAAELRALIGREGDLAAGARVWIADHYDGDGLALDEFVSDVQVPLRHPELVGVGFLPRIGAPRLNKPGCLPWTCSPRIR
jgi:hypothetical protein